MTSRLEMAVRRAHEGILRCASLFVPTSRRSDWLEEWQGELWYVLRECSPKISVHPRSMKEATAFCLGAFRMHFGSGGDHGKSNSCFREFAGRPRFAFCS